MVTRVPQSLIVVLLPLLLLSLLLFLLHNARSAFSIPNFPVSLKRFDLHPELRLPRNQSVVVVMSWASNLTMAGNLNFEQLSRLFPGVSVTVMAAEETKRDLRRYRKKNVVVFFYLEEPNTLPFSFKPVWGTNNVVASWVAQEEQWFDVGLTLCPYTAAWVNLLSKTVRRSAAFYPINPQLIPDPAPPARKLYDVAYIGGLACGNPWPMAQAFAVMAKFRYFWAAPETRKTSCNYGLSPTRDLSLAEVLHVLTHSRVAVVHNVLMYPRGMAERLFRAAPLLRSNEAFQQVFSFLGGGDDTGAPGAIVPQLKERTMSSAACGALMLVWNDQKFNLIEDLFTPGEEFLYWHNETDLEAILTDVVQHYESRYHAIAMRARARALSQYSVERWAQRYLAPLLTTPPQPPAHSVRYKRPGKGALGPYKKKRKGHG
eukprot:RCo018151